MVAICDHLAKLKFSPVLPNAFTEHGAIMVASVLNTKRAIQVSVFVVRAFVKLREMLSTHKELAHKLAMLERKLQNHDESIRSLVIAIRQLMRPSEPENTPDSSRTRHAAKDAYEPSYRNLSGRSSVFVPPWDWE